MPLINFQPQPKVPPIGFFQPISVDPRDMMTDVEYLLGILKKLNQMIAQINKNTEFIEEYEGKIEEIEAEVTALRQEMTAFEQAINQEISIRFNDIQLELRSLISTALTQANSYTDSVAARLEQEIQEISVGAISLFDPTTGVYSPIQIVIDNLYSSGRNNALTATEYDGLELTATAYDGYQLTAKDYDQNGKTLLV